MRIGSTGWQCPARHMGGPEQVMMIRQNATRSLQSARGILLVCIITASYAVGVEPRLAKPAIAQRNEARPAQPDGETGSRESRKEELTRILASFEIFMPAAAWPWGVILDSPT